MLLGLLVVGILAAGALIAAAVSRTGRAERPTLRAGRAPEGAGPDVRGAVNRNSWMLGGQSGG